MVIEFDTGKRKKTLAERGLDFSRADEVFAGPVLSWADERLDDGKTRWITFRLLDSALWCWSGHRAARLAASFS
ncbi:BrnT family toxin [Polaromonas sp. CG_9.11]|uniref:BrnT family toxin n=1 Tax=Polaromonas sp. CG_9.11 TaxID=2787730 RepID=UPI001A343D70|nr:uncharacterized DUF497 family protein [Polaromonas sp. CG_9.11]